MATARKSIIARERKIFLNCLNSWLSNFIIEEFRTDYLPESRIQNVFMGTIDLSGRPLPALFEPKETTIEVGYNYNQEVFQNDVFIYNLDDSNLSEVEFIIRGLQTIKYDTEKILILISNIMTWANTPVKTFTEEEINKEGFDEEEVPDFQEEIIEKEKEKEKTEEKNEINEEDKKSEVSKGSKDTKNNKNKDKDKDKDSKNEANSKNKKTEDEKIANNNNEENSINKSENTLGEQSNQKDIIEDENLKKKEIPKIKTFYYKESEYEKRIPNSKYFYYKILESLALSNTNPNLKVYVICPGFIYGCGENIFFDYFRECFLGKVDYIPIIGDGENHIPTIHVLDLVQVIKRIIKFKPNVNYIYACDRTKNPSFKNIITSISKGIGGIDIKIIKDFNINEINLPHYSELNIDVRFKLSSVMEDEPRRQKEDIEDYNERKFPWHCEFGIPENMDKLREEFNIYRDLKSIKILVLGPPYSGKSTIAKKISEKYKLSHLTIDKVCDWAKNEKTPLGDETREKCKEMEENIEKAMDEYEHRKNKKKTDPPFDPSQYRKFPNDFLGKIIKSKLAQGECVSKGYILENYPKNYEDCINIYSDTPYTKEKTEEGDEVVYEIKKQLLPDSVIFINNYNEESLKNKLKSKYEDYEERTIEYDSKFNRRLQNYKLTEQISEDNKKLLVDFFKENNVDIHFIDEGILNESNNFDDVNEKIIEFLERNGSIDNEYKLCDEEEINIFEKLNENIEEKKSKELQENEENKNKSEKNSKLMNVEKSNSIDKAMIDSKENNEPNEIKDEDKNDSKNKNENENSKKSDINNDNKEAKIENLNEEEKIQQKLNEIKERETNLLEKKSEVLRRYLSENVMPLLAKGVLNVCQNMPDDPVEALANFLLENSLDIKENGNHNKTQNELEKIMDETIN